MRFPPRSPWTTFPEVVIHGDIAVVQGHASYAAAKAGDADAAASLVSDTCSAEAVRRLMGLVETQRPVLSPVHALEVTGVNAIPLALAEAIATHTGWDVETTVVQTNLVGHTGASGFRRMARQAHFEGDAVPEGAYVLVDDFVGQGGTLASLRGHLLSQGSIVVAATVLTGSRIRHGYNWRV